MLSHLHSIRLRQPPHRPLTRAVMAQQRKRLKRHNRSRSDQLSRLFLGAVALLDELQGAGFVAVVEAEDVDAEHALEVGFGEVEQGFDLGYACVCYPAIYFVRVSERVRAEPVVSS